MASLCKGFLMLLSSPSLFSCLTSPTLCYVCKHSSQELHNLFIITYLWRDIRGIFIPHHLRVQSPDVEVDHTCQFVGRPWFLSIFLMYLLINPPFILRSLSVWMKNVKITVKTLKSRCQEKRKEFQRGHIMVSPSSKATTY